MHWIVSQMPNPRNSRFVGNTEVWLLGGLNECKIANALIERTIDSQKSSYGKLM